MSHDVSLSNPSSVPSPDSEKTREKGGFRGVLNIFQLGDIIQMYCLSGASITIRVKLGAQEGSIFIRKGNIVHAVCNETIGEEAFYQIISWKSGDFETVGDPGEPETTIERNWQFLLLEAARMTDELALANDHLRGESAALSAARDTESIRVLIVDDSPLMCNILQDLFATDEAIQVVGVAHNGEEALRMLDARKPDLVTLDINMPVMNGPTTLKHIMVKSPCPILILSRLSSYSQENIIDFLRLGAVDFMSKPRKNEDMPLQQKQIIAKVKEASRVRIGNLKRVKGMQIPAVEKRPVFLEDRCDYLVVLCAGSGGYGELIRMISSLPKLPNTCFLAFQDMAPDLLIPLAQHLHRVGELEVVPMMANARLLGGRCYLTNLEGGWRLAGGENGFFIEKENGPPDDFPNFDAFNSFLVSIRDPFPPKIAIALLSGARVGNLEGLFRIRHTGGRVLAQPPGLCLTPHLLENAFDQKLIDFAGNLEEMIFDILDQFESQSEVSPNSPGEGEASKGLG